MSTTQTSEVAAINRRPIVLVNADAFLHLADEHSEPGDRWTLCNYAPKQIRELGRPTGNRSFVLCPTCMLRLIGQL